MSQSPIRVLILGQASCFERYIRFILGKWSDRTFQIQRHDFPPPQTPDLVFYTYWNKTHHQYKNRSRLIFMSGEAADVHAHAHAHLIIDCKLPLHLRPSHVPFVFLPFFALSFWERYRHTPQDMIKPTPFSVPNKTKFCAFMYNHDVAFRNDLFRRINNYKHVDALGKCMNTTRLSAQQLKQKRYLYEEGRVTFYDTAVDEYRPYKFMIACENCKVEGYITEKVINGMLAGCIPIYSGAPDIAKYFNPKSMICVDSFPSFQDALDYIARVDQDDNLYRQILEEPWFPNNELPSFFDGTEVLEKIKTAMERRPATSSVASLSLVTPPSSSAAPSPSLMSNPLLLLQHRPDVRRGTMRARRRKRR